MVLDGVESVQPMAGGDVGVVADHCSDRGRPQGGRPDESGLRREPTEKTQAGPRLPRLVSRFP